MTALLVKEKNECIHTHTHARIQTHPWIMKRIHPCTFLCCTVHNKSCFIKAKSHPLSVYNHRSRLNRQGNTIPFRFRVILIYELVSTTLVCGYEPGKHPQQCNIAPTHSHDRLEHTKQLAAHIYVCNCVRVWLNSLVYFLFYSNFYIRCYEQTVHYGLQFICLCPSRNPEDNFQSRGFTEKGN